MGIKTPKMFLTFKFFSKKSNAVFIYQNSAFVGAVIIIALITEVLKDHNDPLAKI